MFYSLTGRLVHMEPGMLAVECGGVAFKCFTSMHTQKNMPRIGEVTTVYTHLNVREDALDLFGFASKSEMNCFKMLTGISGVGPKVALAILSEMTPEGVAMAAASGDSKSFTRANGVGPKLAQRIVLELKDKVEQQDVSVPAGGAPASTPATSAEQEALAALQALGYTAAEAARAVSAVRGQAETTDRLIMLALRQMSSL